MLNQWCHSLCIVRPHPPQDPGLEMVLPVQGAVRVAEREWGSSFIGQLGGFLKIPLGIPGWLSSLAPTFSPGRDPRVPGSSPALGSCRDLASPSACVSASLSLSLSVCVSWINKIFKKKIPPNWHPSHTCYQNSFRVPLLIPKIQFPNIHFTTWTWFPKQ